MPDLPKHNAGLALCHDEHKTTLVPVQKWIEEQSWFEWVSDEQRQKAIETDSVWTLQWCPVSPEGYHALAAAELAVLLETANTPRAYENAPV